MNKYDVAVVFVDGTRIVEYHGVVGLFEGTVLINDTLFPMHRISEIVLGEKVSLRHLKVN